MSRIKKVLLFYVVPCLAGFGCAAAYEFFIGYPRIVEGRRVYRITVWSAANRFQRERVYYTYYAPDGKEVRHGTFQRFEDGHLAQQATYRNGKFDGPIIFWNVLGEKTQEIYYRGGTPYGWANYAHGKLVSMRQEITQDGRNVAVKTFGNDHYALEFKCGELINAAINPTSGEISSIANPSQRACAQP